jgi:hypothetical protein
MHSHTSESLFCVLTLVFIDQILCLHTTKTYQRGIHGMQLIKWCNPQAEVAEWQQTQYCLLLPSCLHHPGLLGGHPATPIDHSQWLIVDPLWWVDWKSDNRWPHTLLCSARCNWRGGEQWVWVHVPVDHHSHYPTNFPDVWDPVTSGWSQPCNLWGWQ